MEFVCEQDRAYKTVSSFSSSSSFLFFCLILLFCDEVVGLDECVTYDKLCRKLLRFMFQIFINF